MFGHWRDFLRNEEGSWAWDKLVAVFVSLAGLAGGVAKFYYGEIYTPSAIPVNVSMDLSIQRLPQSVYGGSAMIPVQLNVTAKNESAKILRINKTHWLALVRPLRDKLNAEPEFINDVNAQMALGEESKTLSDSASSRFQKSSERWDPVGFGPLFDTNEIRPKEEIQVQRIIYVPANDSEGEPYRLLRVKVSIPTYKKPALAEEDLVRIFGGFLRGETKYVEVYFCLAERDFRKNTLRWWFDKFLLPRDPLKNDRFDGPEARYCPTPLSQAEREQIGAQVFVSTYEIDLIHAPTETKVRESK